MTDAEILNTFTRILRELLGNDRIVLLPTTERQDVPDWDSFAYINFIVAAEMELGIHFRLADVEAFRTVGDIVAAAQKERSS